MTYTERLSKSAPPKAAANYQAHCDARETGLSANEHEAAMRELIHGWLRYADAYAERYASNVGADEVLGEAWGRIGRALRELLVGEIGRLDAGTLDGVLFDTLQDEGFADG